PSRTCTSVWTEGRRRECPPVIRDRPGAMGRRLGCLAGGRGRRAPVRVRRLRCGDAATRERGQRAPREAALRDLACAPRPPPPGPRTSPPRGRRGPPRAPSPPRAPPWGCRLSAPLPPPPSAAAGGRCPGRGPRPRGRVPPPRGRGGGPSPRAPATTN